MANWFLCNLTHGSQTKLRHLKGSGQYRRYWLAQKTREAGYAIKRGNANLHTVTFNAMLQGKRNETVARAFVRDESQGLARARVRCRIPLASPEPRSLTMAPSSADCQPFPKECQLYLRDHVPTGLCDVLLPSLCYFLCVLCLEHLFSIGMLPHPPPLVLSDSDGRAASCWKSFKSPLGRCLVWGSTAFPFFSF